MMEASTTMITYSLTMNFERVASQSLHEGPDINHFYTDSGENNTDVTFANGNIKIDILCLLKNQRLMASNKGNHQDPPSPFILTSHRIIRIKYTISNNIFVKFTLIFSSYLCLYLPCSLEEVSRRFTFAYCRHQPMRKNPEGNHLQIYDTLVNLLLTFIYFLTNADFTLKNQP